MQKLLLVADDAGFASTDRGIVFLAEQTRIPLCAEYMITQDGALERAQAMKNIPNMSLGLHFELLGTSDADRVALTKELKLQNQTLGLQVEYQKKAIADARTQLDLFMSVLGRPAHISTHGNFHVDLNDHVMPWWENCMSELFDGDVPPMQMKIPIVRHNLYRWNTPKEKRNPLTPEEFGLVLAKYPDEPVLEFVMHPAVPESNDDSIDMLFDAEMRVADLHAAIEIIQSGVIQEYGFEIVSASDL